MVFEKVKDLSDVDSLNPESMELGLWLLANWQGSAAAQERTIKEVTVLISK